MIVNRTTREQRKGSDGPPAPDEISRRRLGHEDRLRRNAALRSPGTRGSFRFGTRSRAGDHAADRPADRGRGLRMSPVKQLALAEGLRIEQPERISTPDFVKEMKSLGVEALTVAAFGQILRSRCSAACPTSTSTPPCCRSIEERRRSSAPSWPASERPAYP